MKYNPFKPNAPVHAGMFQGRGAEIIRIDSQLVQTAQGNPGGFIVMGERGIGKSSLLLYARALAEGFGKVQGLKLNHLVIHTDIDASTTQLGLVKKIELGLEQALAKSDKAQSYLRKAWQFLERIQVEGMSIKGADSGPDEVVIEQAAYALSSTIQRLTNPNLLSEIGLSEVLSGILLLIDEADNASPELDLGAFLKLLAERVHRSGCSKLLIGLAGLPRLRDVLVKSHESSLRLFEELSLKPLSQEDVGKVIDSGLEEANQKNSKVMTIAPEARSLLMNLSEGLPHFIQQFSYSAFEKDSDWNITPDDVTLSAFGHSGAVDQIGNRYYRDKFFNKIKSTGYRQVLREMAVQRSEWVRKDEIKARFKGKRETLDNAIHALTKQGFIVRKEGDQGVYRLVSRGFAFWILFKTSSPVEILSQPPSVTVTATTTKTVASNPSEKAE